MSEENLEITRQVMEAFNRRDRDAWLRLQDPELEFRADPGWPESETVRGRDASGSHRGHCRSLGTRRNFEMGEVIDAGATGFGPVDATRSRQDERGSNVLDYWCVFTFRRGRILRTHWFAKRDQALEAVGLSE